MQFKHTYSKNKQGGKLHRTQKPGNDANTRCYSMEISNDKKAKIHPHTYSILQAGFFSATSSVTLDWSYNMWLIGKNNRENSQQLPMCNVRPSQTMPTPLEKRRGGKMHLTLKVMRSKCQKPWLFPHRLQPRTNHQTTSISSLLAGGSNCLIPEPLKIMVSRPSRS